MTIKTNRAQEEPVECTYLKVYNDLGSEFRISENKFGEIVINKFHQERCTIQIEPVMGNEIIIK